MGSRGPELKYWKAAVVDDSKLPPIQPGEHMTVGQVRHPELQEPFEAEFEKWYLKTKADLSKRNGQQRKSKCGGNSTGKGKPRGQGARNADAPCASLLVQCLSMENLTLNEKQKIEKQVTNMLGWDKITIGQLHELLEDCNSHQALKLLLRGSTQYSQESRERHKQQQKQQQRRRHQLVDDDDSEEDSSKGSESTDDVVADEKHSWFKLVTDVPVDESVRVDEVPDTDEREKLRGAKGIWATRTVPACYVLGPYRHYLMYVNTYDKLLDQPGPGWEDCPASWRLSLDSYACTDESFKYEKEGLGQFSLVYSAWGYGNETAYANDPHKDPIGSLSAELPEGRPDEYLGPKIRDSQGRELDGNCKCGVVSIAGWPYMFMYTTSAVTATEEFLYSYGHGYWTITLGNIISEVKDAEYRKLLEDYEQLRQATSQLTSGLTTSMQTATPSIAAPSATQSAAGTAASLLPAPAVSGLSSLGRNMEDMQLTAMEDAGKVPEQPRGQGEQEGVGESPAGKARERTNRAEGSPAANGAVSGLATAEDQHSDIEDDASSVMPQTLLAYRDLRIEDQLREKVQRRIAADKEQRLKFVIRGENDEQKEVTRVRDPHVAKLIREAEKQLSRILYDKPNGMAFGKFKSRSWWSNELQDYEYDAWEFIRRRPQYFDMHDKRCSDTSVISLTVEWRQEVEPLAKLEGWPGSQSGYGQGSRKRSHKVVIIQGPQESEEMQLKRQKVYDLLHSIQQHMHQEGIRLPPSLDNKLQFFLHEYAQEPTAPVCCQAGTALAATAAVPQEAAPNRDAGDFEGFDLTKTPIPGMGGDDDSEPSSSESDEGQQEPSSDEDDSGSDGPPVARPAAANNRAASADAHVGGSRSGRPAGPSVRADTRSDHRQQPQHQAVRQQPPNHRQNSMTCSYAQAAHHRSNGSGPSKIEAAYKNRQQEGHLRMQQPAADHYEREQHMPPPGVRRQQPASHSNHSSRAQQFQHMQGSGGQQHQYPGYHAVQSDVAAWVGGRGQLAREGQGLNNDHRERDRHNGHRGQHRSNPVSPSQHQPARQHTNQHTQWHGRQGR